MRRIQDCEDALTLFEEASIRHQNATEDGDFRAANYGYGQIESAIRYLQADGNFERLVVLLEHPSIGVRLWAASYLLPEFEVAAGQVLAEIAAGHHGIHSWTAETTLSEWKNRRLGRAQ